ncbi:hypothetical protein [Salipiger mangrovisoli]|uniref:Polyketide cyclase / dehydrase and lipid transport n=1 Tax=Salipiger mangrovisoli TaxID=2865933 RepID=A0ABR9WZ19_9RHOB|nr:hypothetical protein [Salipiger mangrovisoli]MBE9636550.1 hypothetical protein [Salipiger mangrovisoli]
MTSRYIESETEVSITFPAAPSGVTGTVPEVIWSKLEGYTTCRWSTAVIDYVVNPPCEVLWKPYNFPATIDTVNGEAATVNEFGEVTISERCIVRCTIGGQPVTDGVEEAYKRLADYYAGTSLTGVSRYSIDVGDISESWSRRVDLGALGNSGAAELLKKYRKEGAAHV